MQLSETPKRIHKPGDTVRYRIVAHNDSHVPRVVTLTFGGDEVAYSLRGCSVRRLGGGSGFILPSHVSLTARADGPGIAIEVL
jgi:hypothetical protein